MYISRLRSTGRATSQYVIFRSNNLKTIDN